MKLKYFISIHPYLKTTNILYIVAFSLYCIGNILDVTVVWAMYKVDYLILGIIVKAIRYAAYMLFILKVLYDTSTRREYIYMSLFIGVLLLVNFIVGEDRTFLFYFLIIIASYNVTSDLIIKNYLFVVTPLLIIFVVLSRMNLIVDYIIDKDTRNRHFLGFSWTTTAPILFLFIVFCYIFIKKGRINIVEFLVISIAHLYFFKMTNTKLAFAVAMGTILFFWIFKDGRLIGFITTRFKWILILIPSIMAIVSYVGVLKYDPSNPKWIKIDNILTGRLHLGQDAIETYGINLFGNRIDWIGYPIFDKYRVIFL